MVNISGGDGLEKALAEISRKVSSAAKVDVGFLEGATYPDGKPVAMVAAIQEWGAPKAGIPPRPFFRDMIKANSKDWPDEMGKTLVSTGYDAAKTLGRMGKEIEGELAASIVEGDWQALSPITVMLRGMRRQKRYRDMRFWEMFKEAQARVDAGKTNYGASTKPLVDKGIMLRAISSAVS